MGDRSDLTGRKYERLEVLRFDSKDKSGNRRWLCKCDCGNEKVILGLCLKNGGTKSCGCLNQEARTKTHLKDLTKDRFGRLTVLERAFDVQFNNGCAGWLCKCDCGNEKIFSSTDLLRGRKLSCGCYYKKNSSELMTREKKYYEKNKEKISQQQRERGRQRRELIEKQYVAALFRVPVSELSDEIYELYKLHLILKREVIKHGKD